MGSPNVDNLRRIGFKPGSSGNPGGRPKMDPVLRTKLRDMSPEIVERLKLIALKSESEFASIAAGKLLLAYAWGNPEGSIDEYKDPRNIAEEKPLTVEEKRAMARRFMTVLAQPETADDESEADES